MRSWKRLTGLCATLLLAGSTAAGIGALLTATPAHAASTGIRYCCTPQQVNACAATGGSTTCRTGVCQCQF